MPYLRLAAAALALAWANQSLSQAALDEEDLAVAYGDRNFISIATGARQPIQRAPAVASVITAEDIAAMGATDLDAVLEAVPGIHVSRASVRYAGTYLIRGIGGGTQSNAEVLLLQDGVPMTTMFNGDKGAAWRGTPVGNIARIEVIRGPGSALYGADAYAGVINIITKTAREAPGTEIGAGAGSYRSWDSWMHHGGQVGPVGVAAYLRVGTSEGFKGTIPADAQTRNDQRFGTRASLAPGGLNTGYDAVDASLNLNWGEWRAHAAYKLRDNLESGAGVSSALIPDAAGRAEVATASLGWNAPRFSGDWGLGWSASFLHYRFTHPDHLMLLPPGTVLSTGSFPDGLIGGPNQWERQARISAFATWTGLANHSWRFGAGHDDLDLYKTRTFKNYVLNAAGVPVPAGPVADYSDIQPFIRPQARQVTYAYLQDECRLAPDWTLTAGLRRDNYSDFGGTTNPRLALVWDAAYDLTAKLLYGSAFRAPSFNEQYGINPVANGNPGLKPATVRTLEAALAWQLRPDARINLSVFRYAMKDIIQLVANPAPAPGSTYQNAGRQTGSGMEIEATWDAGRQWRFAGHYAYQRSQNEEGGHDAGYAPHHRLYLRAEWRFAPGWELDGQVNGVAARRRAVGDTRRPVADYATADLTLRSVRSRQGWQVAASIRNLFDADAREPTLAGSPITDDLPLPRRSFWLQGSYTL